MRSLIILLVLALCACAGQVTRHVVLTDNTNYVLQPPPDNLIGEGRLEQLQVTSAEGSHSLLLQTEYDGHSLQMSGLAPSGVSLFDLSWHAQQGYQIQQNLPMPGFDIGKILAYYQLSAWPVSLVSKGLLGEARLEQAGAERVVKLADESLFRLTSEGNIRRFVHLRDKYQIEIRLLEQWQLHE
ncbi:DUF3261 domain-containing protein [Bowmanella pacifica]|uniref:DUF3261 domain-containing protein n=1 Tax=Bowmanella pacifica TaxID=502051 RepID=UPI00166B944E|nr:DUF3261 domain-containing protein [Bowmanella pacifica]